MPEKHWELKLGICINMLLMLTLENGWFIGTWWR